jgi:hypothetical protein
MDDVAAAPVAALAARLERDAYAFLAGSAMRALLLAAGSLADWERFAASWNDMPVDTYMADGGRYRRRRHAVFAAAPGAAIRRAPHQAHYQSRDYNPLHGGIERWFEPVRDDIAAGSSLTTILGFCRALFARLAPGTRAWRIETHQFRIEARPGVAGKPTPEGMHRDGVDYVLVLLIRRQNIRRGTTAIHAPKAPHPPSSSPRVAYRDPRGSGHPGRPDRGPSRAHRLPRLRPDPKRGTDRARPPFPDGARRPPPGRLERRRHCVLADGRLPTVPRRADPVGGGPATGGTA